MRTLTALLLASVTISCSHPQIANFGFYSYDPETRDVVCQPTPTDPTGQVCETLVREGLEELERADIHHFRYAGVTKGDATQAAYDKGAVVVGFVDKMSGTTKLGVTMPDMDDKQLIRRAVIALNPDLLGKFSAYAVAVMAHELLHALGAMHAECSAPFKSIMAPAVTCPAASEHVSYGDRQVLRNAYPGK